MRTVLAIVAIVLTLWAVDRVVNAQTATYPVINANGWVSDGSSWIIRKMASLTNFTVSTTLTGRNSSGAALIEKGGRWSVVSFPAANSQGTASIAAEAAVRHVVDCVSWAADASAAVTAAAGNVALRDGATGAGTVIGQWAIAHTVAAGAGIQTVAPHSICGLNLIGTTNTAMTLEFNAGVTGEVQSATITGYNVN